MMLPDDLKGLFSGGGAAPSEPGQLPGDLSALFAPGGAEAPAPEESASITDGSPGGGEEALTEAIDLIQVAIDAESDQEDIQVMLQCQTKLQQILAKNQADADSALQGKTTPKSTRKMASGAGGGY